eukprot:5271501-Karenia_brevis.AAC.1
MCRSGGTRMARCAFAGRYGEGPRSKSGGIASYQTGAEKGARHRRSAMPAVFGTKCLPERVRRSEK